jgi:hypothetical protein
LAGGEKPEKVISPLEMVSHRGSFAAIWQDHFVPLPQETTEKGTKIKPASDGIV